MAHFCFSDTPPKRQGFFYFSEVSSQIYPLKMTSQQKSEAISILQRLHLDILGKCQNQLPILRAVKLQHLRVSDWYNDLRFQRNHDQAFRLSKDTPWIVFWVTTISLGGVIGKRKTSVSKWPVLTTLGHSFPYQITLVNAT